LSFVTDLPTSTTVPIGLAKDVAFFQTHHKDGGPIRKSRSR